MTDVLISWAEIIKEELEKIANDNLFVCPNTLYVDVHYVCDGNPETDDPIISICDKDRPGWVNTKKNSLVTVHVLKHHGMVEVEYLTKEDCKLHDRVFMENVVSFDIKDPECINKVLSQAKKGLAAENLVNFVDTQFNDQGDFC